MDAWEELLEIEYWNYKDKYCACETDEDCACLSLNQYKQRVYEELARHFEDLEEQRHFEGHA